MKKSTQRVALSGIAAVIVFITFASVSKKREPKSAEPVAEIATSIKKTEKREIALASAEIASELRSGERTEAVLKKQNRMDKLIAAFEAGSITEEEQLEFWDMVRSSRAFEDRLAALQGEVSKTPRDDAKRMKLASLYLYKLLSVPSSPERGVWASKAEGQWNAVLKQDPDHWEARHLTAFTLSQYPDFLNRQNDSIGHYEKLVELQSRMAPQSKFEKTYVELSRMYLKKGDRISAEETASEGLALFPESRRLLQQRRVLSDG